MYGLRLWDVYAAAALAGSFSDGKVSSAASAAAKTADKLLALRAERDQGNAGLGEEVYSHPYAGPAPAPAEIIATALEGVAGAIEEASARADRL